MAKDKNKFLSLAKEKGGMMTFGKGQKGKIRGVGKIGKSKKNSIKRVYHVKGLNHNLPSISQLCDKENKVTF